MKFLKKFENFAYHYGDLGTGRDTYQSNMNSNRTIGHFGTGIYFLGKQEKTKRPEHKIDLTKYNLYKPSNKKESMELHELSKKLNSFTYVYSNYLYYKDEINKIKNMMDDSLFDYIDKNFNDFFYIPPFYNLEDKVDNLLYKKDSYLFELLEDKTKSYLDNIDIQIDIFINNLRRFRIVIDKETFMKFTKENASYLMDNDYTHKIETVFTKIMKHSGYDGINNTDIPELDNWSYGSVIYNNDLEK